MGKAGAFASLRFGSEHSPCIRTDCDTPSETYPVASVGLFVRSLAQSSTTSRSDLMRAFANSTGKKTLDGRLNLTRTETRRLRRLSASSGGNADDKQDANDRQMDDVRGGVRSRALCDRLDGSGRIGHAARR